jgi:hypothetical protein
MGRVAGPSRMLRGVALAGCGGLLAAAALLGLGLQTGMQHRLYDELLYARVARDVTAGARTDAERVDRLTQYVFTNVHVPSEPILDDDGPPAETLTSGYGFCDQQVRLFMQLAAKAGLATREIFLLDTATGTSPHTVAEVREGSQWAFVDVLFGYDATRPDGSPATLQDVIASSDPIIRLAGLQASDYENARVQLEMQPGLAEAFWRLLPSGLVDRMQDAYVALPAPSIPVPGGLSRFDQPDERLYWQARNFQLFGRNELASSTYDTLLASYPSSALANDARYNAAVMASSDAPQEALHHLNQLQSHQPAPAMRDDGLFLAGQILENLADKRACENALGLFDRVAAQASEASVAAAISLGQTPCGSVVQQPLAQLGPMDLANLRISADGVSLLWRAGAPMAQDYTIFVHALDAQGQVIAQNDAQPDRGALPTSSVRTGALIPDDHRLKLPPDTAQLEIGAYLLSTGQRLTSPDGMDHYLRSVTFSPGAGGQIRPQLAPAEA